MFRKLTGIILTAAICLSLLGVAAVSAQGEPVYSQDFSSMHAGDALPDGWKVTKGSVKTGDGYIEVGSDAAVLLPDSVTPQNFTYEVKYTIVRANEQTRWAGFMFRYQPSGQYQQMCCRQNAGASNGVDSAMYTSGGWKYPDNGIGSYIKPIDPNEIYTAKIMVNGDRVALYINDVICVATTTLIADAGRLGVQTAGSVARVYGVTVSEPGDVPEKLPDYVDQMKNVYEPETGIVAAPSVIQNIDSDEKLDALNTDGVRTQIARFAIADKELNVAVGDKTYPLLDVLGKCGTAVLPMFTTSDAETAKAFSEAISVYKSYDVILASDNVEALSSAWSLNRSGVRYAYLAGSISADNTVTDIARNTHTACATIAVITPDENLDRDAAEYLQLRAVSVWADGSDNTDEQCVYNAIDCGANGVTVKDFTTAYGLYEKVTEQTNIRKTFIVGHRGSPFKAPENSKESYLEAVADGADAIECDVQTTSDGVLISNHNGTLEGYTTDSTAKGSVSNYTWDKLSKYTLKAVGSYKTSQFCKMEWYFQILKDNPELVGFVEFKNMNDTVVKKTVKMMEEMGVENQVVFICFGDSALSSARNYAPYAGTARLAAGVYNKSESVNKNLADMMKTVGYTAAAPDYGYADFNAELVSAGRHRGITFQSWTVDAQRDVLNQNGFGVACITTNNPHFSSNQAITAYKSVTAEALFGEGTTSEIPSEPSSSEPPVSSDEPTSSETPVSSDEPTSSETPVSSDEPTSSEAPVSSDEPTSSEAPVSQAEQTSSVTTAASDNTSSVSQVKTGESAVPVIAVTALAVLAASAVVVSKKRK